MPRSSSRSEEAEQLVLVVEDDPDTLDLIEHALADPPVPLVLEPVTTQDAALRRLEEAREGGQRLPALVLLDLSLGQGSGFEVLAALRAAPATQLVPVVAFSSSTEARDIRRALELGANSYVRKPVAFEDLQATLGQIAAYWLALDRASDVLQDRQVRESSRELHR